MNSRFLVGTILASAVVVGGVSVLSGVNARFRKDKKEQIELENQVKNSGISDTEFKQIKAKAEAQGIPHRINDVYKHTLDSLAVKAHYEKVHLQTIDSLRKVIAQKDDSIKILTKATK